MSFKNDITGQVFGELKILQFNGNDRRGSRWLCLCSCGNQKEISVINLTRKHRPSKTCGCIRERIGNKNVHWGGCGEISATYWKHLKKGALERNLIFSISIQESWELFLKQNRKCALSGMELKMQSQQEIADATASLDRINNNKGYEHKNIQWIHKDINFMKRHHDEKYFIDLCSRIAQYRGTK